MSKPDPAIESAKERGWLEVAAINRALAEGRIDEGGWHQAMAGLVGPAYLAATNPYTQAGHSGDAVTWEASRGFVALAIDRSGTCLDVGCASGILMESVVDWCARRNLRIEPSGLELVPELAALARRRLPHWADRILLGNIRDWRPRGARFDFVMLRPEYAPPGRQGDLVRHVLAHVLKPDGRVIVIVGNEEADLRRTELSFAAQGQPAHGRLERPHPRDARLVRRVFWIDGAER